MQLEQNVHRSIKVIDFAYDNIFFYTFLFTKHYLYRNDEIHLHIQTVFCVINNIDLEKSIFEINTISSSKLHTTYHSRNEPGSIMSR